MTLSIFGAIVLSLMISAVIIGVTMGYHHTIYHDLKMMWYKRNRNVIDRRLSGNNLPVNFKPVKAEIKYNQLPKSIRQQYGVSYDQLYVEENLFKVTARGKKWGAIKMRGPDNYKMIVDPIYDSIVYYPDMKLISAVEYKYGQSTGETNSCYIFDTNGDLLTAKKNIGDISFSKFGDIFIHINTQKGLLDASFNYLFECEYDTLHPLAKGIFEARKPGFLGIINSENQVLLACDKSTRIFYYADNNRVVISEDDSQYYVFDFTELSKQPLPYDEIIIGADNRYYTGKPLYRTLVNKVDRSIDNLDYEYPDLLKLKGKWGVITPGATVIIPNEYDYVDLITENYFRVALGEFTFARNEEDSVIKAMGVKWGLVNDRNEVVIPIEYDWVQLDRYGQWLANTGGVVQFDESEYKPEWRVAGGGNLVYKL